MQSDPVVIRRALTADASRVAELVVHVLQISSTPDYGPENIARVAGHFTPETVTTALHRNHMLVAELAGQIVGTASLGATTASPDVQAVLTFFVAPKLQGTGIGSALLETIETEARNRGITELPVRSSIGGAAFYRSRGFETLAEIWDDDELTYQMSKQLF